MKCEVVSIMSEHSFKKQKKHVSATAVNGHRCCKETYCCPFLIKQNLNYLLGLDLSSDIFAAKLTLYTTATCDHLYPPYSHPFVNKHIKSLKKLILFFPFERNF